MEKINCLYCKDYVFQALSTIYPLTVYYDPNASKFAVRYENCELVKDGKLIENKACGKNIKEACINYIGLINYATITVKSPLKSEPQIYRLKYTEVI